MMKLLYTDKLRSKIGSPFRVYKQRERGYLLTLYERAPYVRNGLPKLRTIFTKAALLFAVVSWLLYFSFYDIFSPYNYLRQQKATSSNNII